jgi:hypothetical protein
MIVVHGGESPYRMHEIWGRGCGGEEKDQQKNHELAVDRYRWP